MVKWSPTVYHVMMAWYAMVYHVIPCNSVVYFHKGYNLHGCQFVKLYEIRYFICETGFVGTGGNTRWQHQAAAPGGQHAAQNRDLFINNIDTRQHIGLTREFQFSYSLNYWFHVQLYDRELVIAKL